VRAARACTLFARVPADYSNLRPGRFFGLRKEKGVGGGGAGSVTLKPAKPGGGGTVDPFPRGKATHYIGQPSARGLLGAGAGMVVGVVDGAEGRLNPTGPRFSGWASTSEEGQRQRAHRQGAKARQEKAEGREANDLQGPGAAFYYRGELDFLCDAALGTEAVRTEGS